MENFCNGDSRGWLPVPHSRWRRCTITENPTAKNYPGLEEGVIDYVSLAKLINGMSFENQTPEQMSTVMAKLKEWKIPVQINERCHNDSLTYKIGVTIFMRHYIKVTNVNPRVYQYDKSYMDHLEDLCYSASALRSDAPMLQLMEFVSYTMEPNDKLNVKRSDLLYLCQVSFADLARKPGQITPKIKKFFENSLIPALYPNMYNIVFPCVDCLRLWLSMVTFEIVNYKIIYPNFRDPFLMRLQSSTTTATTTFEGSGPYKNSDNEEELCHSDMSGATTEDDDDDDTDVMISSDNND